MADAGVVPGSHPDVAARIEALGRASRLSALVGGGGLAILVGSLAVAGWRLQKADADVAAKKLQLAQTQQAEQEAEANVLALEQKAYALRKEAEDAATERDLKRKELAETQALIARSKDSVLVQKAKAVAAFKAVAPSAATVPSVPLESVARANLSVAPTDKKAGDSPLYGIQYSVSLPKERAREIMKVEYFFDHPTFVPKTKVSFDAASGFAIRYLGWGCLNSVKVTVVGNDGGRYELPPVNMCASDAWKNRNEPVR